VNWVNVGQYRNEWRAIVSRKSAGN